MIYGLCEPTTGELRYIGKASRYPASHRLQQHIASSKITDTHTARWIRSLGGASPVIKVLLLVGDGMRAECGMIAFYRAKGSRLTNLTNGGDGAPGRKVSVETRAKMRASGLGRKRDPMIVAKTADALRGRKRPSEVGAKISAGLKGNKNCLGKRNGAGQKISLEHRAKLSAANKGRKRSPEARAKISAAHVGLKHSPETRAKMCAAAQRRRERERR